MQPNGYYQGNEADTRLTLATYADHIQVRYQYSCPFKSFCLLVEFQFAINLMGNVLFFIPETGGEKMYSVD